MKKILLLLLICLTSCHKRPESFTMDFICANCDYEVEKERILVSYLTSGIDEGKYIPDTTEIKIYLDSCLYSIVSKSFDQLFIDYEEEVMEKEIIGYDSKDSLYRTFVNEGSKEIMDVIRRQIQYRKLMHPTYEDKLEFLN